MIDAEQAADAKRVIRAFGKLSDDVKTVAQHRALVNAKDVIYEWERQEYRRKIRDRYDAEMRKVARETKADVCLRVFRDRKAGKWRHAFYIEGNYRTVMGGLARMAGKCGTGRTLAIALRKYRADNGR